MRVIFVDDEQSVLDGINRVLFAKRKDWDVVFATSGNSALAALTEAPADVVVSDMRMPCMTGAELLAQVQERWPRTLRIILSGQMEEQLAQQAFRSAHQLLTKPCDSATLIEAVERSAALQALLQSDELQRVVGGVERLPSPPRIYNELVRTLGDTGEGAARAATLVRSDPALTAKVLQVANSAFYRGSREIEDVRTAVTRIGASTLRTVILAGEVFVDAARQESIAELQERSLLASLLAARLIGSPGEAETAATAALLADVGLLIRGMEARLTPAITHAEAGAYLLGLWGLPLPIVEAVAHHHQPSRVPQQSFGVLGAVHAAVALATSQEPDRAYLEQMGVLDRVEEWRLFCYGLREVAHG